MTDSPTASLRDAVGRRLSAVEISAARRIRVLMVAAGAGPVEVTTIADSAMGISSALGGCLLDDTTIGYLSRAGWFTLYLTDTDGDVADLPDNPHAAALAARLGLVDRQMQARLRGSVLIAGLDPHTGADVDISPDILVLAEQTGLALTAEAGCPTCAGYLASSSARTRREPQAPR